MTDIHHAIHPRIAFRKVDGKIVIVNPATDEMMTLNDTGTFVFERIENMSVAAIVNDIMARFDVSEAQARSDVDGFLSAMISEGLVVECP